MRKKRKTDFEKQSYWILSCFWTKSGAPLHGGPFSPILKIIVLPKEQWSSPKDPSVTHWYPRFLLAKSIEANKEPSPTKQSTPRTLWGTLEAHLTGPPARRWNPVSQNSFGCDWIFVPRLLDVVVVVARSATRRSHSQVDDERNRLDLRLAGKPAPPGRLDNKGPSTSSLSLS